MFRRAFCVRLVALLVVAVRPGLAQSESPSTRRTENVLLVTIDGLRWQEVFRGAEERLISKEEGGVKDVAATHETHWRDTPEARRVALMPFLWNVVARDGQLFGNRDGNCPARVTNDRHFSYPGYNEILCGYPDERIDSNDKRPNPNITVLEWLARRPGFGGRIAAFCSWDTFPYIINTDRCGIPVNAGWQEIEIAERVDEREAVNRMVRELPRVWAGVRYDTITSYGAGEYLRLKKPRVLYVSLGEPDDWAHEGRYDLYLDSTRMCDALIDGLWETAQAMPEYAGKTTLVLTVDHGRGRDGDGWKNHKVEIPGSDEIWMAVMGPDTPSLGVRSGEETTQSQIAATVAALLGQDYAGAVPQAGKPLPGVLP